ncbi:ATP-dependent DNA helicase RecQ [Eubacterium sp. AM05-23]|uniref:DEAD/DEAH box helicase n=1 Tax=Eubacterium TaxID=1730 RepID=UPI000E4BA482|nr:MULTISPECIES: DEAD/DEAH box helicase [Eubacterium]RHO56680.1 ATP-dependent DNA helicase RecQ [Eubacterium sp. AM05-23]
MIKGKLVEYVTSFFNEDDKTVLNLEIENLNAAELFHYHTVKRLLKAYRLFLSNDEYLGDFLIAFRDYMITFDVAQEYKGKPIKETIKYGIDYDAVEGKFFASMQLPKYVNEKFVSDTFVKETEAIEFVKRNDLLTDPLIYSLTSYSHFKSMAQKLAVYGALNAPEGYTALVSLPTGGGKSLVTQTISYQKDGLTIVIVPTISLAIDQERVTKKVIKKADNEEEIFSYSSGVKAGPIFKAIKEQKAKVLFISPEALLENPGFAEVIKEANKCRYLKNIVIDEAHIVVDWGASFRVDYQCLESWRNMLLLTNPSLRTILLSATFEDRCVATLRNFFEVNEKWIEIRCDALRHEPRYTVIRAKSYSEKQKNILELVRKLLHPMIIYVARPIEADQIKQMLASNGVKNTRTFTGLTGGTQRKSLIEKWVDDDYEIMIATSAFGVGVDKSDVRTVVHTYIPQNANTYYQELGRGGRDRLPCLSVMCLQPEDTTIGRDRIKKRVLTPEKIIGRWDSLYNNPKSQRISNNRVFIDTSIKPNYADVDEFDDSPTSDADMNWNVYVLLFLRRFNLIKMLEVKKDIDHYVILIEVIDDRLMVINDELIELIEQYREEEWGFYNSSYNAISSAVRANCKDCISELFYDTYSKVYEYCAGCNAHTNAIIGDVNKFPLKNRVVEPLRIISDEQRQPFGDASELVMILSDNDSLIQLADKLANKGVTTFVLPDTKEEYEDIIRISSRRNVLIITQSDLFNIQKAGGYYYTSGLVAVIYDKGRDSIGKQYLSVRNNLCGKSETRVIHIIKENTYLEELGKNFTELVDGPSLLSDTLYV